MQHVIYIKCLQIFMFALSYFWSEGAPYRRKRRRALERGMLRISISWVKAGFYRASEMVP